MTPSKYSVDQKVDVKNCHVHLMGVFIVLKEWVTREKYFDVEDQRFSSILENRWLYKTSDSDDYWVLEEHIFPHEPPRDYQIVEQEWFKNITNKSLETA